VGQEEEEEEEEGEGEEEAEVGGWGRNRGPLHAIREAGRHASLARRVSRTRAAAFLRLEKNTPGPPTSYLFPTWAPSRDRTY